MSRSPRVQQIIAIVFLAIGVTAGCSKPQPSAAQSAQTRQARAQADRAEELKFQGEDGVTDWRGRVDAAKQALEQAQSENRWGNGEAALEKALDAARLMPPPGKDFELPPLEAGENGEPAGEETEESAGQDGETPDLSARVSNEEVQALRGALNDFLQSLDGRVGTPAPDLSLDRDIIEIE